MDSGATSSLERWTPDDRPPIRVWTERPSAARADRRVRCAVGRSHANLIRADKAAVARSVRSAVLPRTTGIRIADTTTHPQRAEQNCKKQIPHSQLSYRRDQREAIVPPLQGQPRTPRDRSPELI